MLPFNLQYLSDNRFQSRDVSHVAEQEKKCLDASGFLRIYGQLGNVT